MRNKKIIIMIVAICVIAISFISFILFNTFNQVSEPLDNNTNIVNENINTNSNNSNNAGHATSSTEKTNIEKEDTNTNKNNDNANENINEEGESFRGDWTWDGKRIPNSDENDYSNVPRRESSGASTEEDVNNENALAAIDQTQYKKNAKEFLKAFLTYTPKTLKNGDYYFSWQGYISTDALAKKNGIIYNRSLNEWNYNMSTYKDVKSSVSDIKVESLYLCTTGENKNKIVARISCNTERNDALPGEIVNWRDVHIYKESWAIAFDSYGKIVNATLQSAEATNNDPDWANSGSTSFY